ncbi:hypothetical protein GU243_03440 [Pseudarthrobacter psychrotolerans]|uniref:Uncharacterized protein n=1 Tax=Pseudarthrobacter psychrotolerans TaxID=2697569 RepID=A0A6P1NHY7_9MICC|nr:hypothetical protein GU243_03440 [Pseudarthrobacter psychrotolerans]
MGTENSHVRAHGKRLSANWSKIGILVLALQTAIGLFVADGSFRDEIRSIIEKDTVDPQRSRWLDLIPSHGQPVDRSKYSVSHVVIANSQRSGTDWLPFFSKLNLMQNGQQLLNLGFSVSVSRVDVA